MLKHLRSLLIVTLTLNSINTTFCQERELTPNGEHSYKRVSISGTTYFDPSEIYTSGYSTVSIDYRIGESWGLQLCGGITNSPEDMRMHTLSLGYTFYPQFEGNFSLLPTVAIGMTEGEIRGVGSTDPGLLLEFGINARYLLSETVSCGANIKAMACRDNVSFFMIGINLGFSLF